MVALSEFLTEKSAAGYNSWALANNPGAYLLITPSEEHLTAQVRLYAEEYNLVGGMKIRFRNFREPDVTDITDGQPYEHEKREWDDLFANSISKRQNDEDEEYDEGACEFNRDCQPGQRCLGLASPPLSNQGDRRCWY